MMRQVTGRDVGEFQIHTRIGTVERCVESCRRSTTPRIRVFDIGEIEMAFESQCFFASWALRFLFFDDAILPLNGQLPVTVFALRNNRVA